MRASIPCISVFVMLYHWFVTITFIAYPLHLLITARRPNYFLLVFLAAGIWFAIVGYLLHVRPLSGFGKAKVTHLCLATLACLLVSSEIGYLIHSFIDRSVVHLFPLVGIVYGAVIVTGSSWAMHRFARAAKLEFYLRQSKYIESLVPYVKVRS